MTRQVWKFDLGDGSEAHIQMPGIVQYRHVEIQRGSLCLWAEVSPKASNREHVFVIVGTGHPIPPDVEYVGTAQTADGNYVWHVYEEKG